MAIKLVIDPTIPSLDEYGRPVIIPPDGMTHDDLINIPGAPNPQTAPPISLPPNASAQPQISARSQILPQSIPPQITQQTSISPQQPEMDTEFENLLRSMPTPQSVHVGKGRKILDAIATGLGGFKLGQQLDPYNRALGRWETQVEAYKPLFEHEKERLSTQKAKAELDIENARLQTERIRATVEESRKNRETPEQTKERLFKQLVLDTADNPTEHEKGIKQFMLFTGHETPEEAAAKAGAESKARAQAELDVKSSPEGLAEQAKIDAQKQQEKGKLTSNEEREAQNAFNTIINDPNPEIAYTSVTRGKSSKVKAAIDAKFADRPLPRNVSAANEARGVSAQTTIKNINRIEELAEDPEISPNLGPVLGRIGKGYEAIGSSRLSSTVSPGQTESPAEKEQELLSLIKQTGAIEVAALTSGRGGSRFLEYLSGANPDIKQDPERFKGAIRSLRTSESNVLNTIYGNPQKDYGAPPHKKRDFEIDFGEKKTQVSKPSPLGKADKGAVINKIQTAAKKYGVNPAQVLGLAESESDFDQSKTSPTGPRGVFQLKLATAKEMGANREDLDQNIDAGVRYWKKKLDENNGDISKALAAYKGVDAGGATMADVQRAQKLMEKYAR
jgi:Transglycosylase SLT domain